MIKFKIELQRCAGNGNSCGAWGNLITSSGHRLAMYDVRGMRSTHLCSFIYHVVAIEWTAD